MTGDLMTFRRAWKALRNACDRRSRDNPAWRDAALWLAYGADGVARGLVMHRGLHPVSVADALGRWARVTWRPDWTAGDVREWVRGAVQAAGRIEGEAQRDQVVAAGGWRALLRRRGW